MQSAANVNDHLVLPELLDRVRPLRGRPGRPRERITTLIADKGYDYPRVYAELEQRRITGYIPRRGTRDKVTAGRWIVEQTLALLHGGRVLESGGSADAADDSSAMEHEESLTGRARSPSTFRADYDESCR